MKEEIDGYYKRVARDLTNVLFDKRLLADDLSRETVEQLEEYLAFLFQSHVNSGVKVAELSRSVREPRRKTQTDSA